MVSGLGQYFLATKPKKDFYSTPPPENKKFSFDKILKKKFKKREREKL